VSSRFTEPVTDEGELRRVQRVRRQTERHDGRVGGIELAQDGLFDFLRQVLTFGADRITDFLRRFLQILRVHELRDDLRVPVAGLAFHLLHPGDGLNRLFDGFEHLALHLLGGGARIDHRGEHDRRLHLGELVGLQLQQRDQTEPDQGQHGHDGE
jgi:hypothetical protein